MLKKLFLTLAFVLLFSLPCLADGYTGGTADSSNYLSHIDFTYGDSYRSFLFTGDNVVAVYPYVMRKGNSSVYIGFFYVCSEGSTGAWLSSYTGAGKVFGSDQYSTPYKFDSGAFEGLYGGTVAISFGSYTPIPVTDSSEPILLIDDGTKHTNDELYAAASDFFFKGNTGLLPPTVQPLTETEKYQVVGEVVNSQLLLGVGLIVFFLACLILLTLLKRVFTIF